MKGFGFSSGRDGWLRWLTSLGLLPRLIEFISELINISELVVVISSVFNIGDRIA